MKLVFRSTLLFFCFLTVAFATATEASTLRTQTIALRKGWNSVFLEVQPENTDPKSVFGNLPTETVATFFAQTHSAPYLRNPGDAPWREEGWGVWYAPGRPDAFLSNLYAVHANQGYLIYASADYLWQVTGHASFRPIRWHPDAYNFTGFALDPDAPPTFQKFFSGSAAHHGQRVYRLIDGQWTPVQDLARTSMRAGEAYWVYSKGGSDFQGPIRLSLPTATGINFGSGGSELRLDFINQTSAALQISIEDAAPGSLPLAYQVKDLSTLSITYPSLPSRLNLPVLEREESKSLRLLVRRDAMSSASASTLLRVSNGEGVQLWVPVVASRSQ